MCITGYMSIYHLPVWGLFIEYADEVLKEPSDRFVKRNAMHWFKGEYPLIKPGTVDAHLRLMSTNRAGRLHHNPKPHHNVFYSLGNGEFRRYDPENDPPPIMSESDKSNINPITGTSTETSDENDTTQSGSGDSEFASERDLQNYLVKDLGGRLEKGLKLYAEDGVTLGYEYQAGKRRIDILAVDSDDTLVVIELKVGRGHEKVVGQIQYYLGWIENNLAKDNQKVRGIIIAKEITDEIKVACSRDAAISLYDYSMHFSLHKIE